MGNLVKMVKQFMVDIKTGAARKAAVVVCAGLGEALNYNLVPAGDVKWVNLALGVGTLLGVYGLSNKPAPA